MNKEEFVNLAMKMGGRVISLNPEGAETINILEVKELRHEADEWRKAGYNHGYNKAIDDFVERLKTKEEELFEPDYGEMPDNSYERSFNNGILAMDDAADEIAEQLRIGETK